jgi:hypothetical protein
MTSNSSIDEEIRSAIVELIDSAPPAPQLELERIDLRPPVQRPRLRLLLVPGIAVAAALVILGFLLVPGTGPRQVSEAELGLHLMSDTSVDAGPIPAGFVAVANGTFFGNPWTVSSVDPVATGRLCVAFTYLGSVLDNACGPAGHHISNPPAWAVSSEMTSLDTAADGQRYLTAVTNGVVDKLTVSAEGTVVTADALPVRLGNASFFVISLGRERGPCDGLCNGSVTLSFSGPAGSALIANAPTMTIGDRSGDQAYLSAPVRSND